MAVVAVKVSKRRSGIEGIFMSGLSMVRVKK
jgi:hypothetical protein